jgi:hypothetical protein
LLNLQICKPRPPKGKVGGKRTHVSFKKRRN